MKIFSAPSAAACRSQCCQMNGAQNISLVANGDFSLANASAEIAASWAAFGTKGYQRVTGANDTRAGHAAAVSVVTLTAKDSGGTTQVWRPPPGTAPGEFRQLVLSG